MIESREMFVGLTERFDESLVLLRALRAPDLDIDYEAVNVARRNSIASDLLSNPGTRQAIVEANREDLELYSYVEAELYEASANSGPRWPRRSRTTGMTPSGPSTGETSPCAA